MFGKKVSLLFVVAVLFACEAAFVDNLERCKVTDYECTKQTFQTALSDIGKTGIPELGILPIDPFPVKNVTAYIKNVVDITILDGFSKGIKDCVVQKLEIHLESEHATMEMTCDITLTGTYKIYGKSPLFKSLLGGRTVHGEGLGEIHLDKFHMKFDYHILVKNIGGENYIRCQYEDLKYTHSLGKATFSANNIFFGETESSAVVVNMLNYEWKYIMNSFGKPLLDKVMDIAYVQSHNFFHAVPAKYYLLDDLTSYVNLSSVTFVDSLKRCKVTDYECTKQTFQTALSDIGKTGIPELGILPIDPFPVKNVTASIINMVDITIIDGFLKGIKDCVVQKLEIHLESQHATMEMTCDITLTGTFKVYGKSPLIRSLLGGRTVHGEGLGEIHLDKFYMKFDYNILVKNIDGENYIRCLYEDLKYTHFLGKATFAANNIFFGETESSALVVNMLNEDWKYIMDSFGKPLLDKVMDIAYVQSHNFFHAVPAKHYLLDDLTLKFKFPSTPKEEEEDDLTSYGNPSSVTVMAYDPPPSVFQESATSQTEVEFNPVEFLKTVIPPVLVKIKDFFSSFITLN